MRNQKYFFEVERQTTVKYTDVNDGVNDYGLAPQSVLLLKEPGMFSTESVAGVLHGKNALYHFKKGDLVAVSLCFRKIKINHEYYTQVNIDDIKLVQNIKDILL